MTWDATGYDDRFGFVAAYGIGVLDLLDPQPGESVVDLGCGTGTLTAAIAERGADVDGVEPDAAMLVRAAEAFPHLRFRRQTAQAFTVPAPVDAVFSNAVFHWIPAADQQVAIDAVRRALKPGGRFVAEMGGATNVATMCAAVATAREAADLGRPPTEPWCFPTPAEQAVRLERAGFRVRLIQHVDRPTPLAPGDSIAAWLGMFGGPLVGDLDPARLPEVLDAVDALCAPALYNTPTNPGGWTADYVRLRWLATAD